MWLLNELIFSTPLIIYVCLRIRKLFARKLYKNISTALFLVLVLAFPLAEILSHGSGPSWTRPLMNVGYYALPLLLYLVLTVIAVDLLIGLLRLTRVLSKEKVHGPRFRRFRLGFVMLFPLVVVLLGILNFHHLRVKEYAVEVPRRASTLTQLKIVFASDFHLGDQTESDFMDRFVALVNAQDPDLVLIGGDVLEGDRRDEALDHFESQFRRIKSKYGVFAAPGNHEGYGGNRDEFFSRAGIRLLRDAVDRIDGAFTVAGRNDGRSRDRKTIEALLQGVPDDLPLILIDHRPTDIENISRTRADIQVSGHTHHGQLFPINFITNKQYELSWGYKKKGGTHVFVSSGVQVWGPRVRTVGDSEILLIRVAFRDSGWSRSLSLFDFTPHLF
ncbi:MAG: metallophosphoesterase [Candidatus Aminicenantes bacterium]|nr:metallophosphoesterase [Candidatus Aminicenantes bacterium]